MASRETENGGGVGTVMRSMVSRSARRAGVEVPFLPTVAMQDLLTKVLPPLKYAVDGLIPEGLSLLVAAPKIGKSWLANQICVAVAVGGQVLDRRARRGPALYLALEDGERRAQSRTRLALERMGHRAWPPAAVLDVAFNAERGDAMVAQVEAWLDEHPGAVLVVIDVLQKVRPVGSGKRNQYELDAEDVGRVLEISKRHPGLSILVVHHDRKQQATDFLDAVSGTHGISGSVDTILVIHRDRHSPQARIDVTGRDVDETTVHAIFDDGYWVVDQLGGLTDDDLTLYRLIESNGPMGPSALGQLLGKERSNVHRQLKRLVGQGTLKAAGGLYDLASRASRTDNSDNVHTNDSANNGDSGDNQ